MYEPVHAMFPRSLKQYMCPIDVCVRELVRIAEAEVDVRLRSEVEDGIDLVPAQHTFHVRRRCNITLLECEIRSVIEYARVVERCAIVQFVKRDHVVMRIGEDKMAYKPASSVCPSALEFASAFKRRTAHRFPWSRCDVHEASSTSD